jgi:hypothetical protein
MPFVACRHTDFALEVVFPRRGNAPAARLTWWLKDPWPETTENARLFKGKPEGEARSAGRKLHAYFLRLSKAERICREPERLSAVTHQSMGAALFHLPS